KAAAKAFLERWGIPTARAVAVRDAGAAREAVARFGLPVVLKADGLAAGKGVLLPADEEELEAALAAFFDERRFGASGEVVLVEEFLTGEEVSAIAVCDGRRLQMLASSKDYKRIG